MKQARVLEKTVQRDVVQLLRAIGAQVWELGHKRSKGRNCPHCKQFVPNHDFSTRQTPGIPDVFAFVPFQKTNWPLWVECKANGGRLSPEQSQFSLYCAMSDQTWYVAGGLDDVIGFLLKKGVIHQGQVAHYRVPKAAV